jgi:hypothetical protein
VGEFNLAQVNDKLDEIQAEVLAIEGITWQYAKSGTSVAEIGQACSWALELNTDFAPPTTTEIEPGNYKIDRIRAGVTTAIVVSTPASESAGTIYADYTSTEANWNIGDLMKVTFSGGYTRTDQAPTAVLTSNATLGDTHVHVADATLWLVGQLCRVYDDVNGSEWLTIDSIPDALTLTFTTTLALNHTTANNAGVTRAVRHDLTTAIFFTMLQSEAQSFKILATGTFDTSSAVTPADSTRTEGDNYFNGNLLMAITGGVINQPKLIADYTGTGGIFILDAEQPFTAAPGLVEYVVIASGEQLTPTANSANNQTPAQVIGNKEDTATNDDMSALATASMVAEIKRILLRMSTNAFTADIQGSARTELDVMIGILATYIAASGAAYSVQMNNQTARTNIEQTFEDLATVLGVSGTSVITNINNSANATYDAVAQKFAAIIGADGANVFNPTIQGSARTTLDAALEILASYFTASSAAYSAKVNNLTLRTSLEAILQDYFAVVGCDGTNTFSVTAQGAAQTVLDTALYSLAQYFATNGAAISATVNPGGSARATLELILEDIGDILAGSAGIVTWPGSVKYGNGVSLAEAVAYVSDTADTISSSVSEGTLEITEDSGSSTTVITASEITQGAGFWKGALALCTGGDNDGQIKPVVASAVGSVTVFPAFGATIDVSDTFLLISAWRPDVWNQQPDAPITFNATAAPATVLDLSTAGYSYMVNSLRIKVANPGAQTVTFSLCEVVNGVAETVVDTFVVDSSNYTLYHSLTDMFSLSQWTGDDLKITAVASDAGPYACTGQYQYALARTS